MTVRKCKYEDILSVSELEKECFKGESWAFGTLASAFENPAYDMLVAEEAGEIVGYGCISTVCENCDLENVLVAEAYRKSGIGTAIVEELLSVAEKRGAEKVFLEVRVSNSAAMRMYLACGFVGVYARTRYYSDGEDCLVMQRAIAKSKRGK
ncbi:MAG: ribosomal protein S18-alanine N-acetyltransferase [Clostridia bacterium]|nr:ribosomal protein S18-alanine N-acetyltransferase [Clostridia bacterium]